MKYQQSIASKSIIVQLHTYIVAVVAACVFGGCQNSNEQANLLLNENEICFNEKLMSITRIGEDYYIGTESSGRIYIFSPEKNYSIDTLNTDCGRIYEIEQIDTDCFFVGTQNMGLKKMHKEGNRLKENSTYKINGKDDRYSCYDVFIDNSTVYALTSHGIYQVVQSDTLKPIYDNYVNDKPEPFVASNMVKSRGFLFAATAKGLVRIINNDTKTILKKNIKNVETHDGFIYALSDALYKFDYSGEIVDSFKLKNSADYYFHTDSINYFLSGNQLTLAHDTTLLSISILKKYPKRKEKLEQYKTVNTRRKLSVEGHHVIADSKNYSLLVADNALWQVGHHLPSVFGELKEGGVKQACKDRDNLYFLVGKKVYKLGSNNIANEILELEDGTNIHLMECSLDGQYLYYVKNKNEVWRQKFDTPWYIIGQNTPEKIGKTKKEITAMCFHESLVGNVILGIRDGLISMDKTGNDTIITLVGNNEVDSIPYIRRFAKGKDGYYVPTMNEGLFYGKGKHLHLVKSTADLQFIRDVAYSEQDSFAYLLTNRQLLSEKGGLLCSNNNFGSRLILSRNQLFVPGEIGGVRIIDISQGKVQPNDTILFSDIVFRPESSLELNGTIYLGGQSGVIALKPKNTEGKYPYSIITFKDKEVISRQSLVQVIFMVAIAFIISVVILVGVILNHKKREVLKTRLLELITEYKKLANKNNSKAEEFDVNKAGIILLASKIKHYTRLIGIEETMKRYRLLFTKHEDREKDPHKKTIVTFDYYFVEKLRTKHKIKLGVLDGFSKILTTNVKDLLNKKENNTSEMKLRELNSIIIEHKAQLLQDIEEHINKKIEDLHELSQKEEDTELIQRFLTVFNRMNTNFERFSNNKADELFKLIEEVTINDGRLEMYTQMNKLREKLSEYDGTNDEISDIIRRFYAPTRYYHVDMEIIKQLCLITSNIKEAPTQITESGAYQEPFVLLAITIAKKEMTAKKDIEKYLQSSEKTRNRAYECVEKWLNSDFVKGLNMRIHDDNDSLYSSAFASYLFEALPSKKTTALSQHGKQN